MLLAPPLSFVAVLPLLRELPLLPVLVPASGVPVVASSPHATTAIAAPQSTHAPWLHRMDHLRRLRFIRPGRLWERPQLAYRMQPVGIEPGFARGLGTSMAQAGLAR